MTEKNRYVDPAPKAPVTGLKAAVTTDNAIVMETIMRVLNAGSSAAEAAIAGARRQAAVEPFRTDTQMVAIEDRLVPGVVEALFRLGLRVGAAAGYDYHMARFPVIARDETSGPLTAVADPRRCAVADGVPA